MAIDKLGINGVFHDVKFYYPGNNKMYHIEKTIVNIKRKEYTGEGYHKVIFKDINIDLPAQPYIIRIEALCETTGQVSIIFPHSIIVENNQAVVETSNINYLDS